MYLFFALAGNIAATKVTYFGSLVMDAGFIYSLTFTWRDLIHKQQLGQKAAITTIWLAAGLNLLAALYFQLVVLMPAQTDWANSGGQTAWAFLFGIIDTSSSGWQSIFSLQMRIVLGSILTAVLAELIDTKVYHIYPRRPAKLAAVDAGLRFQCRFHPCGQPALSYHRFFGDSGKGRLAADDLNQYHGQGLDNPPGILDHLPGAGEADL